MIILLLTLRKFQFFKKMIDIIRLNQEFMKIFVIFLINLLLTLKKYRFFEIMINIFRFTHEFIKSFVILVIIFDYFTIYFKKISLYQKND